MRHVRLVLAAVAAAVALTAGCGAGTSGTARLSATADPATSAPPVATAPTASPTTAPSPTTPLATATPASAAPTAAGEPVPAGYDATRDAKADIKAALTTAATDHREVLLDFGANWCPDCRALDQVFGGPGVAPVLQRNYLVVPVDVGQFDHNLELAADYVDLRNSGIPALVVLKADGTVRTATDDGSFSNARTMDADQVDAFLNRWAPGAGRW
ncbi:thioredoxin family protein, partial [Kitasatospora nipponensis]|uniref:thioredoxin family protein n=1 Tax=Kitasatospora nipponensis TaxID=258049 RepID=UPI0031D55549